MLRGTFSNGDYMAAEEGSSVDEVLLLLLVTADLCHIWRKCRIALPGAVQWVLTERGVRRKNSPSSQITGQKFVVTLFNKSVLKLIIGALYLFIHTTINKNSQNYIKYHNGKKILTIFNNACHKMSLTCPKHMGQTKLRDLTLLTCPKVIGQTELSDLTLLTCTI